MAGSTVQRHQAISAERTSHRSPGGFVLRCGGNLLRFLRGSSRCADDDVTRRPRARTITQLSPAGPGSCICVARPSPWHPFGGFMLIQLRRSIALLALLLLGLTMGLLIERT